MLKSRPDESDTLIKNNIRLTLKNHQLEKYYESDILLIKLLEFS